MEKFTSLEEAAKYAASLCTRWSFAHSDEKYNDHSLLKIAQVHDEVTYIDEGSFYVVSSDGAIGLSEEEVDIDWLFLPL